MALNVYRRHGSHCPGGRKLHDMSNETDELRRAWRKCSCPIYASGTLNGHFKRKTSERTTWPEAKSRVGEWEGAGAWEGTSKPLVEPAVVAPAATEPAVVAPAATEPVSSAQSTRGAVIPN